MAPRRPRSNPSPPSRSRARARVPSVSSFAPDLAATGLAYNQIMLSNGQPADGRPSGNPSPRPSRNIAQAEAAAAQANEDMSEATRAALEMAAEGDDTVLLSYQPTPSINPPRPRTLAAGYDRETGTMRVRFREGALYAYYEVTPQEWRNFRRVKSPGRAINRTFNFKPYERLS